MSLLSVIQAVCRRTNVPVPTSVTGTTDAQIQQMMALLEEEGEDLSKRGSWQALTLEASITTVNAESQGAISTIASNGFRYIKNETIWDRTNKLPVLGPMDAQEWQATKALIVAAPRYRYRIRGGNLLVNPVPTAGYSWYFEYLSKNWILGLDGTTYKQYFTLDTDTILLPEELVIMGLRWRWRREKGLSYAQLFDAYEEQVKEQLGRDGGKKLLRMDMDTQHGAQPGIFVPGGSWSLP